MARVLTPDRVVWVGLHDFSRVFELDPDDVAGVLRIGGRVDGRPPVGTERDAEESVGRGEGHDRRRNRQGAAAGPQLTSPIDVPDPPN